MYTHTHTYLSLIAFYTIIKSCKCLKNTSTFTQTKHTINLEILVTNRNNSTQCHRMLNNLMNNNLIVKTILISLNSSKVPSDIIKTIGHLIPEKYVPVVIYYQLKVHHKRPEGKHINNTM